MTKLTANHSRQEDPTHLKALATARMIYYSANDASELGLNDCSRLLNSVADQIKAKFNIDDNEALFSCGMGTFIR